MRLLAVLAHSDDELGCVGTLAEHAARADAVHVDTLEQLDVSLNVFKLYRDFYGWTLAAKQFERSRANRG